MLLRPRDALVCLAILAIALPAMGAEYFVSKDGNDASSGQTKDKAFLTIQKGVGRLKPGDTLTVGPGEYCENVKRADLGSMDANTVIRAEIPGTALLRGDVPAPAFQPVAGYRFVYSAPLAQKPQAVLEHDTLRVVVERANVPELEFDPGYFHYDDDAKILYLSRPDLLSPEQRCYTLAVNRNSGLELNSPRRVVIEGLAVTGFFPGWGILLTAPVSCVVRDCVCFMNVGGIVLQPTGDIGGMECGSDNLVENCVCYGNSFSGISRYVAKNDVIQNCYTYRNVRDGEHFGIMHYLTMAGPLTIRNNISWGQNFDYSVKPTGQEKLWNCVGLGHIRNGNDNVSHNLIGGGNEYDRGSNAPADSILFLREQNLNKDIEFADPLNLDFRPQPGSRFRGTAPETSDRGPYPYQAGIFYVSPTGSDQADGLSSRTPWRTLERALKGLHPGDTLYLMKGEHAGATWQNASGAGKPIHVRGRARDPVTVTGRMAMAGGAGVRFERLHFAGAVALDGSRDVGFNNCTFSGTADGLSARSAKGLRITHTLFAGAPLNIRDSSGVFLSGNLHANAGTPAVNVDADGAVLHSDYNSYKDAGACWQVAGAALSLAELRKRHDRYSLSVDPQLAREAGVPVLRNAIQFEGRGPNGTALGVYNEYEPAAGALSLIGPFLHSTSDTTADIEWWSSAPATYVLTWGDTPEMKNTVPSFRGPERFTSFSLTGLRPGRIYYVKIQSADPSDRDAAVFLPILRPEKAQLSFTTALKPAEPRVVHVAPNGNNGNTGLSREQAFRTINRAAEMVGPGDTVMIGTGDYNETVRIRAAGTRERPITFRSAPGEKAAFQGDSLARTVIMTWKPDYRFDELYFRAQGFWGQGFLMRQCDRVRFTRCLNLTVTAEQSAEVGVRNCVARGGWTAVGLSRCPNSVVENNVFVMTILRHVTADAPAIIRNNIFCECIRNKTHQTLLELDLKNVKESNNCFYLRWPEEEKLAISSMPLPVYRARRGSDAFSANPMMPGTPGRRQGWQQASDRDFDEFFTANPELVLRGIGLQPGAFRDSCLGAATWPYDRPWAEAVAEAMKAAAALATAGKNAEALAAYSSLAAQTPMCDRLKADVLEKASICAERLGDWDRAMEAGKKIPVAPIAMHRQMALMLARKQYAELLDAFADEKMGGRSFSHSFTYPEQEDVMSDLFYFRSIAHREMGNLPAAEADLKIMNDKRMQLQYRSGEAIHDLAWLRLGEFYRQCRKDDDKALAAYLSVCSRTTWAPWGAPPKPASTGASETLTAATKAACEILSKQGKSEQVRQLQADLARAQAAAAAALDPGRKP